MEQPQGADLAGLDRRRAGRPGRVHPGRQPPDRRRGRRRRRSPRTPISGPSMRVPLAGVARGRGSRARIAEACARGRRRRRGPPAGSGRDDRPPAAGGDVLDRPAEQLEARRVELVRPRPDPLGPREAAGRGPAASASRDMQDQVGRPVDRARGPRRRSMSAETISTPRRARQRERLERCCPRRAPRRRRARPASRAAGRRSRGRAPGSRARRASRRPARGRRRGLGLVGVERRRRDEVVVEAVEPLGQVVEQRALGLDHARERVDQPLGVVAGVGVRALGEEDPDERARAACARWRRRTSRRRPRRR